MKLAWGAKVSQDFRYRLRMMCQEFQWRNEQASHLMGCMAFETGGTFSAQEKNRAGSGAVGLIQFTPTGVKRLRWTLDQIGRMNEIEQLDVVEEYFAPYAGKIHTFSDMYMAILAPKAIGMPEETPLYSLDMGAAYRLNAALDVNNDGTITKVEAARFPEKWLVRGLEFGNWTDEPDIEDGGQARVRELLARIAADTAELTRLVAPV